MVTGSEVQIKKHTSDMDGFVVTRAVSWMDRVVRESSKKESNLRS